LTLLVPIDNVVSRFPAGAENNLIYQHQKIMETLELDDLGLSELSLDESTETSGGLWWLPAALVVGLVVSAVNNFGDIRQGIVDGFNGTPSY
jgi:hypothetical protein